MQSTNATESMSVRPLSEQKIGEVVLLHQSEINYGFASYLGKRFLKYLYKTFLHSSDAFGFVAVDPADRVVGFVTGTTNLKRFYMCFVRRYAVIAGLLALPKMFRWTAIKSVAQNLLYPSESAEDDATRAEIISIVVSPRARGKGIGRLLLEHALDEFRRRGIRKVKVLVGDKLQANAFYQKMDFVFVNHITYNSDKMDANIYVRDLAGDNKNV